MAIKVRKPIKIDPVDLSEKVAVGIRLPFNKKKETLNKTINELTKANKENFTKKTANKITKLESKRAELIKAFKVEKKEFFKSQNKLLEKNLKLQEQRSVKLLEKFNQNQSLDEALRNKTSIYE